ncbi:hypothetical protein BFL35_16075 [Clavibacter michiganensis]|nr:hypothetical protein BFL35_16075 [Clavibacter michiganensis]
MGGSSDPSSFSKAQMYAAPRPAFSARVSTRTRKPSVSTLGASDRTRPAVPSGEESSTIIAVIRKSGFSAAMAARRGSSSPTLRASS